MEEQVRPELQGFSVHSTWEQLNTAAARNLSKPIQCFQQSLYVQIYIVKYVLLHFSHSGLRVYDETMFVQIVFVFLVWINTEG